MFLGVPGKSGVKDTPVLSYATPIVRQISFTIRSPQLTLIDLGLLE
jgi:hypothetical protein